MRDKAATWAGAVALALVACNAAPSPSPTSPAPSPASAVKTGAPTAAPLPTSTPTEMPPITWQMGNAVFEPSDADQVAGVDAGAQGILAIAGFGSTIWHSADGNDWRLADLPRNVGNIFGVAADGPRAVAVGSIEGDGRPQGATLYSGDGIAWSLRKLPETSSFAGAVKWTGSEYLVAGGIDWKAGGTFDCGRAAVWHSSSGLHWSAAEPLPRATTCSGVWDVAVLGGQPVVLGFTSNGLGAENVAWARTAGGSWRRSDTVAGNAQWRAVTAGGPGLVAVGSSDEEEQSVTSVWLSSDGISWIPVANQPAFHGVDAQDVTAVAGLLVAVGNLGVLVSIDGTTWVRADPPRTDSRPWLVGVARFGSRVVAVSATGAVWIGTPTGVAPG